MGTANMDRQQLSLQSIEQLQTTLVTEGREKKLLKEGSEMTQLDSQSAKSILKTLSESATTNEISALLLHAFEEESVQRTPAMVQEECESLRIRIVAQAVGASEETEDLVALVLRTKELALEYSEQRLAESTNRALDFSYLIDIDHETSTARMRFVVDDDDQIAQTLYLIQLTKEACEEAGASRLEIELVDGIHSLLLGTASPTWPSLSSTDSRCIGCKLEAMEMKRSALPLTSPAPLSLNSKSQNTNKLQKERSGECTAYPPCTPVAEQSVTSTLQGQDEMLWLEDCLWFVPDVTTIIDKSRAVHILLQALGAGTLEIIMFGYDNCTDTRIADIEDVPASILILIFVTRCTLLLQSRL